MKVPTIHRLLCWAVATFVWGAIPAQTQGVPLTPAHVWSFDDASGLTVVDSVGGNNISLAGFPAGNSHWVAGITGGAVSFKPPAYGITSAPIAAANANQFSISFWLRNDSNTQSNNPHLMSPQDYQFITWDKAEQPSAGVGILNIRDRRGLLVNVWEAYALTVDRTAGVASVYRDGALVASGPASVPLFNTRWVFGHHANLSNNNAPFRGAMDEIQFFDRALSPSEVRSLASRPPQPGLSAHLVAPGQDFPGPSPYSVKTTSVYVDLGKTNWIAWNRFPELRAVSDSSSGLFIGAQRPEVDDYFTLRITNPLGTSLELAMDRNGTLGQPVGQQAMIYGAAQNAPDVVRGDNFSTPTYFDESGAFNSIFTVSGEYKFTFSFRDIFNDGGGYPDVYLLVDAVPEPSSLALASCGALLAALGACRRRRRC